MGFTINEKERRYLLHTAREAIAARLEQREARFEPEPEPGKDSAVFQPCGAFVTLHKGKNLRGCIGRMSAAEGLKDTVRRMALEAAFGDPRFPPLGRNELEQCSIEISALSPMELCGDPQSVQVGVHGLYLMHRGHAGVLLPQVPLEQGWNLQEYLDYICIKAGLPPRSYEAEGASLYTFTAVVFAEE
ncbi:AmmeMemoRadiSam system protein A [Treponema sp. OttesenSCG-928-L16]|nr:AmmeMemoRadiSam system protein A [Treponema sp. OttesenSCG-928-L16]